MYAGITDVLTDMQAFKQTDARQTDDLTESHAYRHTNRSSLETKGVHFAEFLFRKRVCDALTEAIKTCVRQDHRRADRHAYVQANRCTAAKRTDRQTSIQTYKQIVLGDQRRAFR